MVQSDSTSSAVCGQPAIEGARLAPSATTEQSTLSRRYRPLPPGPTAGSSCSLSRRYPWNSISAWNAVSLSEIASATTLGRHHIVRRITLYVEI